MDDQGFLQNRLEMARQELNNLVLQLGISHPSVLQQSMLLDELINQYNRVYYTRTKSGISKGNPAISGERWSEPSRSFCNPFTAS